MAVTMPIAAGGFNVPVLRPGAVQIVASGASFANSTPVPADIDVWRIEGTQDFRYSLIGTASATSTRLAAGVVEFLHVNPGDVLSVIQDSQAGSVSITDMS